MPVSGDYILQSLFLHSWGVEEQSLDIVGVCCEGREAGTWIDSTSHSNSLNAGDLLENPAYVLESLFCDELGFTTKFTGAAVECGISPLSYFSTPHAADLAIIDAMTIEVWAYIPAQGATGFRHAIIAKTNAGGTIAAPYVLAVNETEYVEFYRGDGVLEAKLTSSVKYMKDAWNHIVITCEGGIGTTITLYLNGRFDKATDSDSVADAGQTFYLFRTAAGANYRFKGRLEKVRLWSRALALWEVQNLYNAGQGTNDYLSDSTVMTLRVDTSTINGTDGRLLADNTTPTGAFNIKDDSGSHAVGSISHTGMRIRTGANSIVPYLESQINETSFDAAATARSTWKLAACITDQEDSSALIQRLCYETGMASFVGADGREVVVALEASAASVDTLTRTSILTDGDGKLRMSLGRTPVSDLKTDFIFNYRKNYLSGNYEKSLFCRSPDATVWDAAYCNFTAFAQTYWDTIHAAYTYYNQVNLLEYNCFWIRDEATAELYAKWMINWLSRRHYMIHCVMPLTGAQYELMDEVKFSLGNLLPTKVSALTRWKLIAQKINAQKNEVETEWLDCGV